MIIVRDLKREEIPAVIALYKKSIVPLWKRSKREYDLKEIENRLRKGFGNNKLLAADLSGKVVGCGRVRMRGNVCSLSSILVDPSHQGKGIGRLLMKGLEQWGRAQGARKFRLTVLQCNIARDFYKKLGFEEKKVVMEKLV